MYLKEIKAHGFKSFADKLNIELDKGITGIVGPNGSGKSNVVDAVRWVLGEMSVKQLRGDGNMTDVIFSGSKSRPAMNHASVTLIFDNTDHYFPLAFDEIAIKRRVYKDGTNDFFLNSEKVRLKDITNLLLDSGISKESFNIISQGKIENIIGSKPTDRRVIFEEASGVLKYKRRKEEAIKKLEKTHDNMDRVNDIIKELEPQIEPLKKEKEKAIIYENTKEDLKSIEIALITEDITDINYDYKNSKEKANLIEDEILKLQSSNSLNESKVLDLKTKINEKEDKIKEIQNNILSLTKEVTELKSRKELINERKKYDSKSSKLHDALITLNDSKHSLENQINALETDIINLAKNSHKDNLNTKLNDIKNQKNIQEKALTEMLRNKNNLEIKAESLRNSIENGGNLPIGVKSVLNNPKLIGIHNTIGNIIEVEEKYVKAINEALGYASNFIITDTENNAKEAINSIKEIGRATFFPLNIIKPRNIDYETNNIINKQDFFIKRASDLVRYDPKYNNIILNQLGNILVTDTLENALKLSKLIKLKYKIVTLNGDVIHVGGSMTGGKKNKIRNTISDKYDLENILKNIKAIDQNISNSENQINIIDNNLKEIEDKIYLQKRDDLLKNDEINSKKEEINKLKSSLEKVNLDIRGYQNTIGGTLSKEEEEVTNEYFKKEKELTGQNKELEIVLKEKEDLNESLEDYEISNKKESNSYNEKVNELNELKISINRMDVKLDNLLNNLSETYEMTYENARKYYKLEIDKSLARNKVSSLKRKLKEIGNVNLNAKEEYDRVSQRYEFLVKQIDDLTNASNTLKEIINEMDKVMVREFKDTFDKVNENFKNVFKELFHGGEASLKLTEPNNLLETGIEINAMPPGKKLTTISLLSGGEKTLTAISLLFAIILTRPAPFVILDEVEAALDDVNVDSFGKYILKLKQLSQFIIITHKKKTMEYADVLYGITMQESGVSKLVSVKLEDLTE